MAKTPKSHHAIGIGCMSVLVFCALALALGWLGGDDEPGGSPEVRRAGAESACREYVSARLKAPASADFSGGVSRAVSDFEFVVSGEVDSQNGFGAMLRSRYTCSVRLDVFDSTWALLDLSIT